jgi:hypothetical protein
LSTEQLDTVHSVESSGSLVDFGKLDVTETLGGTSLAVGRETNRLDISVVTESLVDGVLGEVERETTEPEGGGGLGFFVSESLGTLLRVGGTNGSIVDLDRSAINLLAVELESLLGLLEGAKLYVTETTRSLRLAIDDDTSRDDGSAAGKLGCEPVIVNVPRQLSDEHLVGRLLLALGGDLGLLGGCLDLLISLALWR